MTKMLCWSSEVCRLQTAACSTTAQQCSQTAVPQCTATAQYQASKAWQLQQLHGLGKLHRTQPSNAQMQMKLAGKQPGPCSCLPVPLEPYWPPWLP